MGEKMILEQEIQTVEQLVDSLTLFDDDLMSAVFNRNIQAAELLLRIILKRDDIRVISVEGQEELNSPMVGGRNITLDILITDHTDKKMNVEVQRRNGGAHVRRARFHSSMVDARMLQERQKFMELEDSFVIFITEKDYFKRGLPIYTVERQIKEIEEDFSDGSHIIYVNGSYKGDDDIGKLMHDFHCRRADEIYFPELADSVRHFKEEGGRKAMCEAVEKYANRVAEQAAKQAAMQAAMQTMVEAGIQFGADKKAILANLCKKFSLTESEAEEVYEKYASVTA